jgi:hypothetical protein
LANDESVSHKAAAEEIPTENETRNLQPTNTMKKTLLTPIVAALVAAFALVAVPQVTEAGHGSRKQVSTCSSCRQPVYAYAQYAGRRSCGTPIYRWVTQQHTSCSHRSHSSSHSSSNRGPSHSSSSRYGSSNGRGSSYGSSYSRGRSGFSISFGRGRSSCR